MTSATSVVARAIATAGGAGYARYAPGTWGTAVAAVLTFTVLAPLSAAAFWAVCVITIGGGIWAAGEADRAWGTHDSGRIVIDEVAGFFITVAPVPDKRSLWWLLAAFVVFRALDILKPPPVRWIDRHVPGGAGVVLDDVAAGILGAVIMIILGAFCGWS
ncbi:MAG TPA: phosphatidylglycerophosphatase A [Kofleriaceae bacterium]|nr:phosphatidylglycerophosphatase A [Kofleriaceae bacterium]